MALTNNNIKLNDIIITVKKSSQLLNAEIALQNFVIYKRVNYSACLFNTLGEERERERERGSVLVPEGYFPQKVGSVWNFYF